MNFTDLRLRFRRFMRNNGKIAMIIGLVWLVIIMLNLWVKNKPTSTVPETTYDPHVSIMSTSSTVPSYLQEGFDDYIEEYINYCNESEFEKAFDMVSPECRKNVFHDSLQEFKSYLITIMPTQKIHTIQNYSNISIDGTKTYIYQVKYMDDILATGLTDQEYAYTEEKITFTEGEYGLPLMCVGNYMYHEDVKRITENEYLKIDVKTRDVYYSMEEFEVVLTNRSEYTIVIADGTEKDEISLTLNNESRNAQGVDNIVLEPGEKREVKMSFVRFVDDGDNSNQLAFNNIRVMEVYSGTETVDQTVIENEKNNAIAKFSSSVVLN